jgi:iron complex transport system substrate-binding protein
VRTRSPRLAAGLVAVLALSLLPGLAAAQSPAASPAASAASSAGVTITDADGNPVTVTDSSKVATLGGVITETAWALGAADQIVAVDASSYYPPEATQTKTVLPYYRMLSAEPVLAAGPTLILGTKEVGPPEVVQQLKDAGVTVLLLPQQLTTDGAKALITAVGQALGRDAEATALNAQLDQDLAAAQALVAKATSKPKVMMLLLPPGAPMLVSGTGTEADTMIGLAGGVNALTDFPGYVPLTPEAAVAAAPDIILTTSSSLDAAGGLDGLLATPGIGDTPAGKAKAVVAIEDLELLGFGPRVGKAIADLATRIHPELAK